MKSTRELIAFLKTQDLATHSPADLAAWCQALGQSGRGTKGELVKRLTEATKDSVVIETKSTH